MLVQVMTLFTATDGQDVIYAGAGNDLYRVTNLPSQVDISQGAKMVDMTAAISFAGNVVVGATFIGPDADELRTQSGDFI